MATDLFDVLIVGGGAAGCVLARRLADAGTRSVLLLEAGPDVRGAVPAALRDGWNNPTGSQWTTDWGFVSEPDSSGATNPLRRGRLLGGTSWLTRFAVRGPATDYDGWVARGNPGWRYEDVLPSFCRLETDAEFANHPGHGDRGPIHITRYLSLARSEIHAAALEAFHAVGIPGVEDLNAANAVGVGAMPMSTRDGLRITSLDAYLPAGRQPANLTIRVDSPVGRVVFDRRRAIGVELVDGSVIAGGWVILAAGTYGSPTLLMRSGIGPADHLDALGIDISVNLPGVGENLADHPGVDLDSGWAGAPRGPGEPVLHTLATFRSSGTPDTASPDLMFWVQDPSGPSPAFYFDPVLLKPESRGSVRLRSKDPADRPVIRLPGLGTERDIDRLADAYLLGLAVANHPSVREVCAKPPPARPASRLELRQRVLQGAYSNPHVVGTCRMGPSPDQGDVVDALGIVHGTERLSVIDASIIPEPPSGFPHVITIMLAEHLATRLQALV